MHAKVTQKILEKVLVSWKVDDLKDLRWCVKLIRPTWCVIFHSHILRMLTCYSESKENRKKQILSHAIICIERQKIRNKINANPKKKGLRTLGAKSPNVFQAKSKIYKQWSGLFRALVESNRKYKQINSCLTENTNKSNQ